MNDVYSPKRLVAPCEAQVRVPGSKSVAQRALVAACLSEGTTRVVHAGGCDDVLAIERGLAGLGFELERAGDDLTVRARRPVTSGTADVGESGTALRLLLAVAALLPGEFVVTGRAGLRRRPVGELVAALRELGADVRDADGSPPVTVRGGDLRGGRVRLDATRSSQFASALMLVAPDLPGGLELELAGPVASPGYLELTRRVLEAFGGEARIEPDRIVVPSAPRTSPGTFEVEGDWSAAGAFTLLAELCGGRARILHVAEDSPQPDRRFGELLSSLRGSGDRQLDVGELPDQTMNLAVAAALRPGVTELRGIAHLRLKESDRLAVTARELNRLGGRVEVLDDGLRIRGGAPLNGGRVDPEGDHRMAMAFAVLGAFVDGVEIATPGCVAKSFPGFYEELERALETRRCVALIGMRGSGKTALGVELARHLALDFVDTDEAFEAEHGPIATFVGERGWPAFRDLESRELARALRPGRVVATGGGVLERESNAQLLGTEATVLYLDATLDQLRRRVTSDGPSRPSLTGRPVVDELEDVFADRRPAFLATADGVLEPHDSPAALTAAALDLLRRPWLR